MLGQGVAFLSVHYCESPLSQMAEWEAPFGVAGWSCDSMNLC